MKLSEHFSLSEFEFSDTAARHGLDNEAPAQVIERLKELCETLLEPIRDRFGAVRITSGYRCLELNRLLKSKDTSQHTRGEAADIVIPNVRPLSICDWIAENDLPYNQNIHEFGRWTHISIPPVGKPPKRENLTIDRHGTAIGLHEARP